MLNLNIQSRIIGRQGCLESCTHHHIMLLSSTYEVKLKVINVDALWHSNYRRRGEVVTYHMKNGSQHAINVPVKSFQQIKEISKSLQLRQASKPATRYVWEPFILISPNGVINVQRIKSIIVKIILLSVFKLGIALLRHAHPWLCPKCEQPEKGQVKWRRQDKLA